MDGFRWAVAENDILENELTSGDSAAVRYGFGFNPLGCVVDGGNYVSVALGRRSERTLEVDALELG